VKLLFDENLSPRLAKDLEALFPGSQHVDHVGLHGCTDEAVWEHARLQGFTIVSKDNDFRQRSFLKGAPPKAIWLSVGNAGTDIIGQLLRDSHARIETFMTNLEESLLILELADESEVG
jgi:predicted nuclease of predicted toxin-antitoxin system